MGDAEIIKEFLVESYENLDRLDQDLIALEKDPANRETLASVFRTIHTIKGTSGFLAFNQLEALTHVGENLLARLRDGQLALTAEITTALLSMVDAVRQMLASIENAGNEGTRNDQELSARLTALLDSKPPAAAAGTEVEQKTSDPAPVAAAAKLVPALGDILVEDGKAKTADIHEALQQQNEGDPRHVGEILIEKGAIKAQDVVDALNTQQQARGQGATDSSIRVDVGQLDRLMNRVGELVLLRNQIVQYINSTEDSELLSTSQRLNLLTTELQESVMKTRMQPIGNIWSKFPRTVRDVAVACGKQVRIEMAGKETELDKTIIEAIKDPLTHLVRNAVDHGIEAPQVRQATGKSPEGLLSLRAFHEGGQVNIEISDDGAGLNYEKIRNKARQRGLITADQASRMTEREIANLIFLPGLSTAEKVSNVSGRGVGMDVVKTNIEKIGGTVDVQSKAGQGTTVRMKIPLTLAIIPALIVTSAGDRYAIPQVSLLELVRLEGEQARKGIELVNGAPVHRLRGRLLPLVYLNEELDVGVNTVDNASSPAPRSTVSSSTEVPANEMQSVNMIVLRADDRQFGLVVDEINDTEEIVVKPLSKQLKSINAYAGATIMGDGKVALILDVLGLAQRANVVSELRESVVEKDAADGATAEQSKSNAVLLFQYGEQGRIAVDLSLVARLEEFPPESVEKAADQEVVQYRGQIMPLLRVSEVLESKRTAAPPKDQEALHVVVYADKGRSVGLVVDRILDIVDESFVIQLQSGRRGIVGSAVIQKRVTDILDVPGLIAAANPEAGSRRTSAVIHE
ncbi:MAG TPA: chemotaxis protein CheW [Candidatus Sulfotelmatobacter sp.]|nr:chemotaxis protein CheW [Candidatus Sulfotelmatobacter sp.]